VIHELRSPTENENGGLFLYSPLMVFPAQAGIQVLSLLAERCASWRMIHLSRTAIYVTAWHSDCDSLREFLSLSHFPERRLT
jgi:hypothetical protein